MTLTPEKGLGFKLQLEPSNPAPIPSSPGQPMAYTYLQPRAPATVQDAWVKWAAGVAVAVTVAAAVAVVVVVVVDAVVEAGRDLVVCPPLLSSSVPPPAQVRLPRSFGHQTPSELPEHPAPNHDIVHPNPIRSARASRSQP